MDDAEIPLWQVTYGVDRWIPVAEFEPPPDLWILVWTGEYYWIAMWDTSYYRGLWVPTYDGPEWQTPTHWRPLPDSPEVQI